MSVAENVQPSGLSPVEPNTSQTGPTPPASSHAPFHSSSSSTDSISSFKSALNPENTRLGTNSSHPGLALRDLLSNTQESSPSPAFSLPRQHNTKLGGCPRTHAQGDALQDSSRKVASSLDAQPDDVAVWDDCEQSLEDMRKEVVQSARPPLRRRMAFLRYNVTSSPGSR